MRSAQILPLTLALFAVMLVLAAMINSYLLFFAAFPVAVFNGVIAWRNLDRVE